jgi:hypothetical protein
VSPLAKSFNVFSSSSGDLSRVHFLSSCLADGLEGLLDDVEVAQAQEVDLEEPQGFDVAHRVLDHDAVLVLANALERHDVGEWLLGDDDARGVGPGVAAKPSMLKAVSRICFASALPSTNWSISRAAPGCFSPGT